MSNPTRPVLRWHGGKWLLAPWILGHFPAHQVYVEPFGGAASVLMQKERSYAEIYNDLDDDVVTLFRVLRDDEQSTRLLAALRHTPFARTEFVGAYEVPDDPIERARNLVIRSFMGFGSNGHNIKRKTGFRANSNRSGTTPARDWLNYPDSLALVAERLRGVIVENRPAVEVMLAHDGPQTLHYVDPPYLPETRSGLMHSPECYAHEMTTEQHVDLLTTLCEMRGMVILSGYPAPLYDGALPGWRRVERKALVDGASERTEVLWINPAAAAAVSNGPLFEAAA